MKIVMGLAALTLLAACGQDKGAGGLTAEESRQLNEAAAMLDEAPDAFPTEEARLGGDAAPAEAGELPVAEEAATDE
jgi:hypothetical protein